MLLHYVVAVMVTVQWSFSVVTNPVTTVNECWPVIILSATRNIYTVSILQISWQYASKVYWIIRQVYLKHTCFKYASRVIACQIIQYFWMLTPLPLGFYSYFHYCRLRWNDQSLKISIINSLWFQNYWDLKI